MEINKCKNCGSTEFVEGIDNSTIKPYKVWKFVASNKIYTFCLECEEVLSIRIENTGIFKVNSE